MTILGSFGVVVTGEVGNWTLGETRILRGRPATRRRRVNFFGCKQSPGIGSLVKVGGLVGLGNLFAGVTKNKKDWVPACAGIRSFWPAFAPFGKLRTGGVKFLV